MSISCPLPARHCARCIGLWKPDKNKLKTNFSACKELTFKSGETDDKKSTSGLQIMLESAKSYEKKNVSRVRGVESNRGDGGGGMRFKTGWASLTTYHLQRLMEVTEFKGQRNQTELG